MKSYRCENADIVAIGKVSQWEIDVQIVKDGVTRTFVISADPERAKGEIYFEDYGL